MTRRPVTDLWLSHQDVCLLEVRRMKEKYGHRVKHIGFSGHHQGTWIDIAAYTLGATWNERHFTKDRTWKGTDHAASLEPHMLKELIEGLNHTYQALTYKDEDILPIEMVQRKKLKYGQYNADDIKRAALKKGKIYSEDTQKFGKK